MAGAKSLPKNKQKTGKSTRGGKRRTSWKPGQSGNPKGAPRKGLSWKELILAVGEEQFPGEEMTRKEMLVRSAFLHAMKGNAQILKELMQRSEPQPDEVNIHHDWREVAKAYGLTEAEVLAEAERIIEAERISDEPSNDAGD